MILVERVCDSRKHLCKRGNERCVVLEVNMTDLWLKIESEIGREYRRCCPVDEDIGGLDQAHLLLGAAPHFPLGTSHESQLVPAVQPVGQALPLGVGAHFPAGEQNRPVHASLAAFLATGAAPGQASPVAVNVAAGVVGVLHLLDSHFRPFVHSKSLVQEPEDFCDSLNFWYARLALAVSEVTMHVFKVGP
jgi:hypothetical protein